MIVSVTTLGASDGDAAGAATKVVKYLEGRGPADQGRDPASPPELPGVDPDTGIVGYYADSMAQPGIWMGEGFTGVRMDGLVDPDHLHRVLLGQHPLTGEQLVGAAGSAQRAHAETVSAALNGPDDELLSLSEAAKALGVGGTYLRQRAAATDKARTLQARQAAAGDELCAMPASYLDATRDGPRGHWKVTRAELRRFAAEREKPNVVVGYDLTFSAPKSVSILWATANPAQQVVIEAALTDSVRVGVAYLESHAAQVRVSVQTEGTEGRHMENQAATGLVASAYLHETSRALDPQLHFHVVVANMAEGPDAKIRTLDARGLYFHAKTASHLAASELRHRLSMELGVAWNRVHRGLADLEGVPRNAIVEMSQRARQMDEHIETMVEHQPTTARGRQIAAYDTRAPKDAAVDPDALRPAWAQRLDDVGFDRRAIDRCYGRQRGPAVITEDDREQLFNLMASPEGVTEFASTFDRRDVLQFVSDWGGDRLSAAAVGDLADAWLVIPEVVPLDTSRDDARRGDVLRRSDGRRVHTRNTEALYTTRQMLSVENSIDAAYLRGRDAGLATVPTATVDAVLATRGHLGDDQVEMVRAITASSARIQAVYGPAGAGKTTALEAAARAWELEGFNVIGGAVQGTAAEIVGDKAGVRSATVASVLWRVASNDRSINARTKILVDECSALGNRDFMYLTRAAEKTGASLVLVGDPAQHTAVAAGGAWRRLLAAYPDDVARLREVRRQKGAEMADVRQALAHWRAGDVDTAVNLLDHHGRVVTAANRDDLMTTVVDDWYGDRLRRRDNTDLAPSSMMTDRHRERRELNALARERLVADGTLTGPVLRAGELEFQVGDEVMALEQDRELRPAGAKKRGQFVHTAERGRVIEVRLPDRRHDGSLLVDFARRGPVEVPMEYLTRPLERGIAGALAHSYALTTHAAQGDTYDAARPIATDASSSKSIYVGVTRATHDVRLYVAFQDELSPSTSAHPEMPRLRQETNALAAVITQIKDDRDELLATEIDPFAAQVAAMARSHNLAQLEALASSKSLAAPIAAQARDQALDTIARTARLHPDADLLPRIGPRPTAAADRRLWDEAVGQAGVYRARYAPTPVPNGSWVTWALGPVPDDGAQRADYSLAGGALAKAERAALRRRSPADLAAQRADLRRVLATRHGPADRDDAARRLAQASAARDQASAAQSRATWALDSVEHPKLRRPNAARVATAQRQLAQTETLLNQAIDSHRVATEQVAALQPHAVMAAREPVEWRLKLIDDAIADHVDEAIASPAAYLVTALGPRSDNPTQRPRWDKAARCLETWRQAELGLGPDDGPLGDVGLDAAVGPVPDDSTEALRRSMVLRDVPVEFLPHRTIELGIDAPGLSLD